MTLEYADAMRVPEHYTNTIRTRALQSVDSRVMSKCRTRRLESCDTLSSFFHAWLERGVREKPPKDPRLSDGWRWQLGGAFLLLSPGVYSQWSPGSARMMTDVECVENLAGLSAVKELKSSRASCRWQCSVLRRRQPQRVWCTAKFSTKELTHDVQTPSMLSILKPRRVAWYLVGGADLSPFFVYSDEPGATSVQADVDWSGNEMTCRTTSAGAVQLESHEIEAWSVIQQVVSFSSAESETYAIEASRVDRWETPYHRRKQNRRIGVYPRDSCRTIQAVEKVPDTIDSINKEAKCTGTIKEKLLGPLESSTQKAAIAHERRKLAEEANAVAEFAFASPREPPDKISPGLDTLENAKERPSDLTRGSWKERRCQAA